MSFLFLYLSALVLTLFSFQIQPAIQEHEELVWLAGNLKLEVTKHSKRIYGPRGFCHPLIMIMMKMMMMIMVMMVVLAAPRLLIAINWGRGITSDNHADRHKHTQTQTYNIFLSILFPFSFFI